MIRITPTLAAGSCMALLLFSGAPTSLAADTAGAGAAMKPADAPAHGTPRLADGRPDLSGYWRRSGYGGGGGGAGAGAAPEGDVFFVMPARNGRLQNLENDSFISQKGQQNVPQYRPEFWAKVRDLDYNGNTQDPSFNCFPAGVPRVGPPVRIVSLPGEEILFHVSNNPASAFFRFIHIGKPRNKADLTTETWLGIPEARWDGDTLVIDSIGFNDQSWLGWGGFFHTSNMHVTERLRREGDVLHYSVVVEDPTVLTEPWLPDPVDLTLDKNPNANIPEIDPCFERDSKDIVNHIRG
jgi:hypothetical protein